MDKKSGYSYNNHRQHAFSRNSTVFIGISAGFFFLVLFGIADSLTGTNFFSEGADALYGVKGFFYAAAGVMIAGAFSAFIPIFSKLAEAFYKAALGILSFFLGSGVALYLWALIVNHNLPDNFSGLLLIIFISVIVMWFVLTRTLYDLLIKPSGFIQRVIFFAYFFASGFIVANLSP